MGTHQYWGTGSTIIDGYTSLTGTHHWQVHISTGAQVVLGHHWQSVHWGTGSTSTLNTQCLVTGSATRDKHSFNTLVISFLRQLQWLAHNVKCKVASVLQFKCSMLQPILSSVLIHYMMHVGISHITWHRVLEQCWYLNLSYWMNCIPYLQVTHRVSHDALQMKPRSSHASLARSTAPPQLCRGEDTV